MYTEDYDLESIGNHDWKIGGPAIQKFIVDVVQPQMESIYRSVPVDKIDVPVGEYIPGFVTVGIVNSMDWDMDDFVNRNHEKIYMGIQSYVLKFKRNLMDLGLRYGEINFRQRILTFEDPTMHKYKRVGIYGWGEVFVKEKHKDHFYYI